jgi:glutathione S-transferase
LLLGAIGGLKINHDTARANTWPADKEACAFRQLPLLIDGDVRVNQSLAIVNYVARKTNLQGETDAEFAISQMLISEYNDLYDMLVKIQYLKKDKTEDFAACFAGPWGTQLGYLVQLLGQKATFTGKLLAGDVCIWAVLDIAVNLKKDLLDGYPTLKAFYENVGNNDAIKAFLAANPLHMWFTVSP